MASTTHRRSHRLFIVFAIDVEVVVGHGLKKGLSKNNDRQVGKQDFFRVDQIGDTTGDRLQDTAADVTEGVTNNSKRWCLYMEGPLPRASEQIQHKHVHDGFSSPQK